MHIKHAPYIRTCVRTVHTHVRTFGMCVYDRCVRVCVLERRCRISVSTRISSESQLPYTPCTDEARFLRMLFTESLYRCSQAQTLLDTYILVRVIHHYVRTHIRRPKKNYVCTDPTRTTTTSTAPQQQRGAHENDATRYVCRYYSTSTQY